MKLGLPQGFLKVIFISLCAACIFLFASCRRGSATATKSLPYSVTNIIVDGESTLVFKMTNGISLFLTHSNLAAWFWKDSEIAIGFDPETLKLSNIFLNTSSSSNQLGQSVLDLNADGIPDIRELKDATKTRQIFFHGEWYTKEKEGTRAFITVDGRKIRVHFDGQRWLEVTN